MSEELTRLHRSTALHIQRQLSARPRAGNFVAQPLEFLQKPPFLPYVDRNIEKRIEKEIMKHASFSKGELTTFPEPLAILSESGSGKSILVARLAQRLMRTTNADPEQGTLVLFSQLKNAQGSSLLEEICSSVGLGRFSTLHDLRSFLPEGLRSHRLILFIDSLDESQHRDTWPGVDRSLRTPPKNSGSGGFNDVLPIWVSRRHDWRVFSPDYLKHHQGLLKEDSLRLDIGKDETMVLLIHKLVNERQKKFVDALPSEKAIFNAEHPSTVSPPVQYLAWALGHYQILHLPRTIHSDQSSSEALFKRVMNTALDHLDALSKAHAKIDWYIHHPENWSKDLDMLATARTNLAYALLSATVEEAVSRVPSEHQEEARKSVDSLLSEYSQHALDSLEERSEVSDALPRHLSSANVHLLSALSDLGIVLRSDHDALHYRWAHRDLTAISILAPFLNESTDKKFRDILTYGEQKGWDIVLTNAPGYGRKSSRQFHRKSGRALQFTKPFSEYQPILSERPTERLNGTPWEGLEDFATLPKWKQYWEFLKLQYDSTTKPGGEKFPIFKQLNQEKTSKKITLPLQPTLLKWATKRTSSDQKGHDFTAEQAAILAQAPPHTPLIIKGPPGTGKTWLGTEVLLGHAKAWNAQAWIITLNSHLAEEIEATVAENHEFGPLHRSIRRAYDSNMEADLAFKNIIKRRVKVFDVEGIMRHLAFALNLNHSEILTDAKLRKRFEEGFLRDRQVRKAMKEGNLTPASLWPRALRDYKNAMFSWQQKGIIREPEDYYRHCEEHPRSQADSLYPYGKKVMLAWHRNISNAIKNRLFPPQYVVGRLLRLISERGPDYLEQVIQQVESTLDTLRPESILIDEIQDLSVSEVLGLMLLTRLTSAEASRGILVGDQFQSLNGNRFTWETWLNDLGHLARGFLESSTPRFPEDHVLHALASLGEDTGEALRMNMRSDPNIVSLVRAAWAWDEDKKHQENEAVVELQAKNADENNRTVIHHIPKKEKPVDYLLEVLEEATQYIELSVLAVDHGLADALRKRLNKPDISSRVRMTTIYDPTMIKGLERDVVLVIGPFMASDQGEFPLLVDSDTDDTSSREAQIHRLNQHAHVALSRAKIASTVLTYEPRPDGGSQVIEDHENGIKLRQYPNPIDAWRLEDEDKRTADLAKATLNLSIYSEKELDALRPFIRLDEIAQENRRAKVDAGLEDQMGRIRSAFIEEFGDLDATHPFHGLLLRPLQGGDVLLTDSSFVLRMIGYSRDDVSRKATDGYERAYGAATRPDGVVLTPEVLNATVDYWFKALEHQNALRLLTDVEDFPQGTSPKTKRKLLHYRNGLVRDMLGLVHRDIGEIYPDHLDRFKAQGGREGSNVALTRPMLLRHLISRCKAVDFSGLSKKGIVDGRLSGMWSEALSMTRQTSVGKQNSTANSFLRGMGDSSAGAWVATEPEVEAYFRDIVDKGWFSSDAHEGMVRAATNLRKWKYQSAEHGPLPDWFIKDFSRHFHKHGAPNSSSVNAFFSVATYHGDDEPHHHLNNARALNEMVRNASVRRDLPLRDRARTLSNLVTLWASANPPDVQHLNPKAAKGYSSTCGALYSDLIRHLASIINAACTRHFALRNHALGSDLLPTLPLVFGDASHQLLDWCADAEAVAYAAEPNDSNRSFSRCFDADAEVVHALLDIVEQHTVHRISDAGAILPPRLDKTAPIIKRVIEFSSQIRHFFTKNRYSTEAKAYLGPWGAAQGLRWSKGLLSEHLGVLLERHFKLAEDPQPTEFDAGGRPLTIDALVPRPGLYGQPSAVLLPTGVVRSDWQDSGRPTADSLGETFTAWLATTRLRLPETKETQSQLRFNWHAVDHPSAKVNSNADVLQYVFSEPSHVRQVTPDSGLPYLVLVVNPLDRIGALVQRNTVTSFQYVPNPWYQYGRVVEGANLAPTHLLTTLKPQAHHARYAGFSPIMTHRTLTTQLGLESTSSDLQGSSMSYRSVRELIAETFGQQSEPRQRDVLLAHLDAKPIQLESSDAPAPEVEVELRYGKAITLYHDVLIRRLNGPMMGRARLTEDEQEDWNNLRDQAYDERRESADNDPIVSWMQDLLGGVGEEGTAFSWERDMMNAAAA